MWRNYCMDKKGTYSPIVFLQLSIGRYTAMQYTIRAHFVRSKDRRQDLLCIFCVCLYVPSNIAFNHFLSLVVILFKHKLTLLGHS